ncbi:MAG: Vacuolar protein sorting-associated protein 41 [Peltula sp. TS41687]|nr:MAG: Vacuolar protein sorting-associated protein 41 [Peltula sp. TS41687]
MDPGPAKRRSIQPSNISEDGQEEEDADDVEREDEAEVNDLIEDDEEEEEEDEEEDDGDDDDTEVDEPKLKYSRLTEYLSGVYRNGDATSTFVVSGDKMCLKLKEHKVTLKYRQIIGTHNGRLHVISMPSFQLLQVYHAHTASVTAISISPYPIPAAKGRTGAPYDAPEHSSPGSHSPNIPASSPNARRALVPPTISNQIHVASSSIDGNICIASLVDKKDVQVRNFGRPLQSVALSPEYKSDRAYLSGGLSGKLILTVGGRAGTTSSANASGPPAATSWLGSLGLGSSTAKDSVLHSGEGAISTIKWSLTGKYVAWVNERGIKIMRSNISHDGTDSDSIWKRVGHIDRPNGPGWEEMSSVWKCRVEWVNEGSLVQDEHTPNVANHSAPQTPKQGPGNIRAARGLLRAAKLERLIVGWGGTVWIIHVHPGRPGTGKEVGERIVARAEIVSIKRFDDCIICGLTLLTPTLLVILAFITRDPESNARERKERTTDVDRQTISNAVPHRQRALEPELRLINIALPDDEVVVSADTLSVGRYQSLSPADYHLDGVLEIRDKAGQSQRGTLEGIGGGLLLAGQRAANFLGPAATVRSNGSSISPVPTTRTPTRSSSPGASTGLHVEETRKAPPTTATSPGMKIYIHSPYDCILAVQRDLRDHLDWLVEQERYGEAWELVNGNPNIVSSSHEGYQPSTASTPTKGTSSSDGGYSEVASGTTPPPGHLMYSAAEKEKRRLGEEWIKQLIKSDDWSAAGAVCGKVLGTSIRWEHWVWVFAQAGKFEEITPFIPTTQLQPPLPPLVYEYVLGHYISTDRPRLKELLGIWSPELFDIKTVTDAIKAKLRSGNVREDSAEDGETGRDWRILMEALAELLIADSRPREALDCYMRRKDADSVMALIRKYNLLDAVSNDIAGFVLLRVGDDQLRTGSVEELERETSEGISLLVNDAISGTVRPATVVKQLESRGLTLFLFLYLRALWKVESLSGEHNLADTLGSGGSLLIDDFGNIAVELFAEFDRPLLLKFLQQSPSYTFEHACTVCERRNYIPELVYLLSKTGETKRALFLIIDKLGDVSQAISFAKTQNDKELWNDLLDYSMDKPRFIRGLLEEVGTAIDPVTLIRRIPEGLEVEGLKNGLSKILKEYELQYSISEGVARIFKAEVAFGLERARMRRKKAIRFDVGRSAPPEKDKETHDDPPADSGRCAGCNRILMEDEADTLIGFACEHIFHLKCLSQYVDRGHDEDVGPLPTTDETREISGGHRSVGAKVTRARILRDRITEGCPVTGHTATINLV